jgi:MGT family glycosyltransferase
MRVFLDEQIRVLEDPLLERVEAPDAVLYDIGGFAGRAAAHRWGVRAVQLSPTYVAWEGYEQDMAEHTAELMASPSGRRYFETLGCWLDRREIPIGGDDFLGRPEACVVLIPQVLQPNANRVGAQYVFAGPCIDERRRTGWTPSPNDDRPLAYVSLGTSYTDRPEFYRDCVSALAADHRLILSTGKVDPAVLEPLPDGVSAARAQPQLDVLDHADVFVTHAGMGSTEAIGAGVQLAAAAVTPDSLRGAVADARGRAGRLRELRGEVRRQGGVAIAADVTEHLCAGAA